MQHIDLYLRLPKPEHNLLSFKRAILIWSALLGICVLYAAVLWWQQAHLQTTLAQQKQVKQRAAEQLVKLTKQHKRALSDPHLKQQVLELAKHVQAKQKMLDVISGIGANNVEGFSSELRDLAQYIPNDVWLTQIKFTQGGSVVDLQGYALQAHATAQFIQALGKAEHFKGLQFEVFKLKQTPNKINPDQVQFELRSHENKD